MCPQAMFCLICTELLILDQWLHFIVNNCPEIVSHELLLGVPKKMWFKLIFEFLTMGRVFLGVKNNSKNFGNKKSVRLLSKIVSKLTLVIRKM